MGSEEGLEQEEGWLTSSRLSLWDLVHSPTAPPAFPLFLFRPPCACARRPESHREASCHPSICFLGCTDQEKPGGPIGRWEDAGWAWKGREAFWGLKRGHRDQCPDRAKPGVLRSTGGRTLCTRHTVTSARVVTAPGS